MQVEETAYRLTGLEIVFLIFVLFILQFWILGYLATDLNSAMASKHYNTMSLMGFEVRLEALNLSSATCHLWELENHLSLVWLNGENHQEAILRRIWGDICKFIAHGIHSLNWLLWIPHHNNIWGYLVTALSYCRILLPFVPRLVWTALYYAVLTKPSYVLTRHTFGDILFLSCWLAVFFGLLLLLTNRIFFFTALQDPLDLMYNLADITE